MVLERRVFRGDLLCLFVLPFYGIERFPLFVFLGGRCRGGWGRVMDDLAEEGGDLFDDVLGDTFGRLIDADGARG